MRSTTSSHAEQLLDLSALLFGQGGRHAHGEFYFEVAAIGGLLVLGHALALDHHHFVVLDDLVGLPIERRNRKYHRNEQNGIHAGQKHRILSSSVAEIRKH